MLIHVRHVTRYRYAEPVKYSVQRLHLTPPSFGGQRVRAWRIEAPGIETALAYHDAFGNLTHLISQTGPHEEVTVTAIGEVETEDRAGVVSDLPSPVPEAVFLRATTATRTSPGIIAIAAEAARYDGLERLHALMSAVRSRIDYRIGMTHAHTTAAEALVPGLGWVGFDVANVICPTDRYVRLAAGPDSRSVAPVTGARLGGADEALAVSLDVMEAQ